MLDLLWNLVDGLSLASGVGVLCYPVLEGCIFAVCFLGVLCFQHYLSGDEWNDAAKKGAVLGLLAALPFSLVSLIFGAIGLLVRSTMDHDYTTNFGRLGMNYRELEKVIKFEAIRTGRVYGSWRDIKMETAINALEQAGRLSGQEARELHSLRVARNDAFHNENPTNLYHWMVFSEQLLQKYRERYSSVTAYS
jgi:hypothetical protein